MEDEVWAQALGMMEEALAWPWPHGRTVFERSLAAHLHDPEAYARDWRPRLVDLQVPVAVHTLGELAQVPALLPPGVQVMLIMRGRCKGEEGVDALLGALERHESPNPIVGLDLGWNKLSHPLFRMLCGWSGMRRLRYLGLCENELGEKGVEFLADQERLSGLAALDLSFNEIGPWGVYAFTRTRYVRRLKHLWLEYIGLDNAGVGDVANASVFEQLTHLYLGGNGLTEAGLLDVLESKGLGRLRHLDLRGNEASAQVVGELLASDRFPSLLTASLGSGWTLRMSCVRPEAEADPSQVRESVDGSVAARCFALVESERRAQMAVCGRVSTKTYKIKDRLDFEGLPVRSRDVPKIIRRLVAAGLRDVATKAQRTAPRGVVFRPVRPLPGLEGVVLCVTSRVRCDAVCAPRSVESVGRALQSAKEERAVELWFEYQESMEEALGGADGRWHALLKLQWLIFDMLVRDWDEFRDPEDEEWGKEKLHRNLLSLMLMNKEALSTSERQELLTWLREYKESRGSFKADTCEDLEEMCETWKLRALTPEPYVGVTGPRWDPSKRIIWKWG